MAVPMKNAVFCDITPCGFCKSMFQIRKYLKMTNDYTKFSPESVSI
jgi:hypothetical protein